MNCFGKSNSIIKLLPLLYIVIIVIYMLYMSLLNPMILSVKNMLLYRVTDKNAVIRIVLSIVANLTIASVFLLLRKNIIIKILLGLHTCFIVILYFVALGMTYTLYKSETYDFDDYLICDRDCKANLSFFPNKETVLQYNDARYYYSFCFNDVWNPIPSYYEVRLIVTLDEQDYNDMLEYLKLQYGNYDSNGEFVFLDDYDEKTNTHCFEKIICNNYSIEYISYCGKSK